jgi:GT2 family glycosyltransferase
VKLHILTLNWNGLKDLKELYPGLKASMEHFDDAEWYVRDNGSKDGSVEWLKENKITLLDAGHNRDNFSQGTNSLWKVAKPKPYDYLLLLNNDVSISDPLSIKNMYDLGLRVKANVVGARLLYKNTNRLQHAGVIFSKRYNLLPFHFRPNEVSDDNAKKNRWFQAVTAACCLVSASSYAEIGGLDENYSWAFEDIDMSLAIGKGKVAYCGDVEIYHEESASLKKNPVNRMFVDKNVLRFRQKWNNKYIIDHDSYLRDHSFNEIK